MSILYDFSRDPRTWAIILGIILDVGLGIGAAVRLGRFEWRKIAGFYRTNVIPFLIGYFALYVVTRLGIGSAFGDTAGQWSATGAGAPIIAALSGSIRRNLAIIQTGIDPAAPEIVAVEGVAAPVLLTPADEGPTTPPPPAVE